MLFQHSRYYLNTTIHRISPYVNYRAVTTTLHHAKHSIATTTTTNTREMMMMMKNKTSSLAVQFSSSSSSQRNLRPSPQYSIYKETSCLTVKPILPTFKSYADNNISLDKPGRILLELIPRRGSNGSLQRDRSIKFALSVEEMGTFLARVPRSSFDLSRTSYEGVDIDKMLKFVANEDGSVTLITSYSTDGIEGQDGSNVTTIELEPGDVEVIRSIFRSSVTRFIGWDYLVDVGLAQAVGQVTGSSSARGGYGSRNDNFTYGGPKGNLTF